MNTEEFESHVIFDRLKTLEEILTDEKSSEKIDLTKLSQFQTIYEYVNQRVKLTIPDLVQKSEMDGLSSEIRSAGTQLNSIPFKKPTDPHFSNRN